MADSNTVDRPKRARREQPEIAPRYLYGLREARLRAGVSTRMLGRMAGIAFPTVSRLEKLTHKAQHGTAKKLRMALSVLHPGMTLEDLYGEPPGEGELRAS